MLKKVEEELRGVSRENLFIIFSKLIWISILVLIFICLFWNFTIFFLGFIWGYFLMRHESILKREYGPRLIEKSQLSE